MDPLTEAVQRGNERAVRRLQEAGIDTVDEAFELPPLAPVTAALLSVEGREATRAAVAELPAALASGDPQLALHLIEDLEASPWHRGPLRENVEESLNGRFRHRDGLPRLSDARLSLAGNPQAHRVLDTAVAVALAEDTRLVHETSTPPRMPTVQEQASQAVGDALTARTAGTRTQFMAAQPRTPTASVQGTRGADHGR